MRTPRWVPALLLAAAPALAAMPASPVHAAQQICVGVVVDFSTLGGPVQTDCAKVDAGATGNEVMAAAGHRLSFRRDGLICAIDGQPADGCSQTDTSHYWSYWHRAPGSQTWQYSSQGSGTYQPANRSTDGWVWQNGGAEGSTKPADVPYTQICPSEQPSPAAAPPSRPAQPPAQTPTQPAAQPAAPAPAGTVAQAPAATTPPSTRRPTAGPAGDSAAPSTPASTMAATGAGAGTATGTPPRAPVSRASADRPADSGRGFPVGLVVGIVVALGLGAAAAVRARR